ncbi:ATP synthase F1 subunit delta [Candidatus Poribacteria bacterium]|nr:ATP synthase F1 subunit delta [Candidatus Poribacteria bacterium]MYG07943.1 ATP synthase F1 subunit delta [Candidatus Poribacteria bacterium]MYK24893.1 ATP synthase F1 subunit delta [Candidatus Poribacteria bacterium]
MRDIRVAKPYARALYDAALEQNALVSIIADIDKLRELIEQSEEFTQLIHSPVLSPQFKSETFQQIFADALQPLMVNFFKLLALKQRERSLIAIMDVFSEIVDEAAGRLVAKVTTAVPITSAQEERFTAQLSAYSGKQVRLETITDAQIQGGFIVQLDDTVFDASVASQLQRLKQQLAKG